MAATATSERQIEQAVVAEAVRRGWYCRKVSWCGRTGAPDRVFIRGGYVLWVEFKAPGRKPSALQKIEHEKMRDAGARVYVVDSIMEGIELLRVYE